MTKEAIYGFQLRWHYILWMNGNIGMMEYVSKFEWARTNARNSTIAKRWKLSYVDRWQLADDQIFP